MKSSKECIDNQLDLANPLLDQQMTALLFEKVDIDDSFNHLISWINVLKIPSIPISTNLNEMKATIPARLTIPILGMYGRNNPTNGSHMRIKNWPSDD